MKWAQRQARIFAIDIEKCENCFGDVLIIASIEERDVIWKILKHIGFDYDTDPQNHSPPSDQAEHQTTLFRISAHRLLLRQARVRLEIGSSRQIPDFPVLSYFN